MPPRAKADAPKRNIDLARRAQIGQEKRLRTRRQVLDAALVLLGREDGLTTRIEEICETAGISRGTFYNYFNGMQELFEALSYELNHDFNEAVTVAITPLPRASERVSAAMRYFIARALKDPQWGWAMVNVSAGGPIFGADTHNAARLTAEQGIAAGEFNLPSGELGRDLQLGVGLAAMITQLREPQPADYGALVAYRTLLAMGVPTDEAKAIVERPLPANL